jgi:hypothetical protein
MVSQEDDEIVPFLSGGAVQTAAGKRKFAKKNFS